MQFLAVAGEEFLPSFLITLGATARQRQFLDPQAHVEVAEIFLTCIGGNVFLCDRDEDGTEVSLRHPELKGAAFLIELAEKRICFRPQQRRGMSAHTHDLDTNNFSDAGCKKEVQLRSFDRTGRAPGTPRVRGRWRLHTWGVSGPREDNMITRLFVGLMLCGLVLGMA